MRPSFWNYTETLLPRRKETAAKIKNTRNRILAIPIAEPAIPPNPNTAAMIAMIKNVTVKFNIEHSFPKKTITAIFPAV